MTRLDGRSVLITGGDGQLASDLDDLLRERCKVLAPARAELDTSRIRTRWPPSSSELAPRWSLITAVERDVRGLLHITNAGACSWHEFTLAIMENAGVDVPVEAVETMRPPGGADRPLNGVLSCAGAQDAGLPALRPWGEAL